MVESYVDKPLDLKLPCLGIPPAVAVALYRNLVAGEALQVHMSEPTVDHIVLAVALNSQIVGCAVDLDMDKAERCRPIANAHVVVQLHNALMVGFVKDHAFGLS